MKATISRLFVAGALALVLPAPVATAEEGKAPTMHSLMEKLDDAYRGFRRETDPAKALPLVREAQDAFLKSMAFLPPMVEKMPAGAEKDKAVATYRNMMAASYLTLTKIELAYLEGNIETVTQLVTELRDARKAGHEKFMEEE